MTYALIFTRQSPNITSVNPSPFGGFPVSFKYKNFLSPFLQFDLLNTNKSDK
jgi:hypothetical protein